MKILWILLLITNSYAFNIKLRAREHYEVHKIQRNNTSEEYRGFTNTINLFFEKPYQYSFGLSFSPVFANFGSKMPGQFFGSEIEQQNIGFELKYFITESLPSLFLRLGVGKSEFEAQGSFNKTVDGDFSFAAIGYEIPFDMLGVAIEYGFRKARYDYSIDIDSKSISIGFHFYRDL